MTSQMFQCRIKPELPKGSFSDAELATYIVRIVIAHEDCEAQLITVRNHLEINGVYITDELTPKENQSETKFLGLF